MSRSSHFGTHSSRFAARQSLRTPYFFVQARTVNTFFYFCVCLFLETKTGAHCVYVSPARAPARRRSTTTFKALIAVQPPPLLKKLVSPHKNRVDGGASALCFTSFLHPGLAVAPAHAQSSTVLYRGNSGEPRTPPGVVQTSAVGDTLGYNTDKVGNSITHRRYHASRALHHAHGTALLPHVTLSKRAATACAWSWRCSRAPRDI